MNRKIISTMRILGVLLIVLWLVFGWWLYNVTRDCCSPNKNEIITEELVDTIETVDATAAEFITNPLLFSNSSGTTILGSSWPLFRDSIIQSLNPNKRLEITGHYRASEKNNSTYDNLGLARANETAKHFYDYLSKDKLRLLSLLDDNDASVDSTFESVTFRALINSKNIKQMEDYTLIYFPFNSTDKLNNEEVEKYLEEIAIHASLNNERIRLIGHTDDVGEVSSNYNLGLKRANIIKEYLIRKGVVPNKILTYSKGERNPLADNDTDGGRARNRRTELKVIK